MAKVYGRRPVLNADGMYYMCEIAANYVYRIEPDAELDAKGYESQDACIWSYLEYLVHNGKKYALIHVDKNLTPMIPGIAEITASPATHLLRLDGGQTFFINEETFDEELIVRDLKENLQGIIF